MTGKRKWIWYGAALLALAVRPAWAAPSDAPRPAEPNPIATPGAPWAFDGFVVNIPADDGWYSTAKDGHYADLSKEYPEHVKAALVVESRKLDESVAGEEALLKVLQSEQTTVPEAGMKLLDYSAEPFSPKGVLCGRFDVQFEDRRPSFPAPGVLVVRGVGCVRPDAPQVIVTLRYAQRRDVAEVLPALREAAEPFLSSLRFLSTSEGPLQQARLAVRGDKPQDAVDLLKPLAEQGDTEAALFLGNIYLYGSGVAPDYDLARRWLEQAAKDGRSEALFNLGAMYDKAIGVPRDVQQAIRLFTLAADQRDPQAQLNLALFYLKGDGVPKDTRQAEAWLRRSAGNGNQRADGILTAGKYKQQ